MNNSAPITSTSASETCATTRPLRNRAEPPRSTPPASSFSVPATSGRVDWIAGTSPKRAPASNEIKNVNPRTVSSGVLVSEMGARPKGRK